VKCELPRASRTVAGDDAVIAPLHHAVAELVAKLRGVDQQERRSQPLRFPREQRERRLERPVCHLVWQPPQLQDRVGLMMKDFTPSIACHFGAHGLPPFARLCFHNQVSHPTGFAAADNTV
jgi:hypothetical protein